MVTKVAKVAKYEYYIVHLPQDINLSQNLFNNLAKVRWEVDSIFIHPNPQVFCQACHADEKSPLFAIFKRQLS